MTDLTPQSPLTGLLPLSVEGVDFTELDLGHITTLIPRKTREKAASEALNKAHGMGFPAPGRMTGKAGVRAIWGGLGQAFLVGPAPAKALSRSMAIVDQSDGWAVMQLSGPLARDVLARLCPLDLRAEVFKRGHTARSLVGHMSVSISVTGTDTFQIMVFRSMAATAAHEISEAMTSVAAQR